MTTPSSDDRQDLVSNDAEWSAATENKVSW
jgi:hypothetical protein